jgi:hypothetical protein
MWGRDDEIGQSTTTVDESNDSNEKTESLSQKTAPSLRNEKDETDTNDGYSSDPEIKSSRVSFNISQSRSKRTQQKKQEIVESAEDSLAISSASSSSTSDRAPPPPPKPKKPKSKEPSKLSKKSWKDRVLNTLASGINAFNEKAEALEKSLNSPKPEKSTPPPPPKSKLSAPTTKAPPNSMAPSDTAMTTSSPKNNNATRSESGTSTKITPQTSSPPQQSKISLKNGDVILVASSLGSAPPPPPKIRPVVESSSPPRTVPSRPIDRRPSINTILAEATNYDVENAKYNASIVGVEERQDAMNSKKIVTLYKIAVSKGSQKWFVFRRFAQFDELDKRLKRKGLLPVTDSTFMGKWQKMKVKGTSTYFNLFVPYSCMVRFDLFPLSKE